MTEEAPPMNRQSFFKPERVQVVEMVLLNNRHEDDRYLEHRLGKLLAFNIS